MKFRASSVVLGALMAGALAGCSSGAAPTGPASAAPESAVHRAVPYGSAPKVSSPLPDSVLAGHPCDTAFTAEQLGELFSKPPKGAHADLPARGPGCRWLDDSSGALAIVRYSTNADGLSTVYTEDRKGSKIWRVLEPIDGLPVVAYDSGALQSENAGCQVSVGITDRSTLDVAITLGQKNIGKVEPCAKAAEVAGAIVSTFEQRSGS